MLVKGYLANDFSKIGNEVEINLDQKYVDEIRQEYLKELLDATIKHVVCPEYLQLFEDVVDWHDYVGMLLNDPEQLFKDIAHGDIQDMVEKKAEEVYEDNKPQYFPVDVTIKTTVRIYVKARSEDEVDDALNYDLRGADIIEEVSFGEDEIEDFYIGSPIDEEYIMYESVYSVEEGSFI